MPLLCALQKPIRTLTLFAFAFISANSFAQGLQREWVRTYSLGKTNQASAIMRTPDGNVIVAGSSGNTSENADYLAIKYSPAGEILWQVRFDSGGEDTFRAMTLDPAGNLFLTGTSETVKYNSAGTIKWAFPVAGRAIVANAEFVYVTGASDVDFSTTQLENNETNGRDLWTRTYDGQAHSTDIAQSVTLDPNGNVYVSGMETLVAATPPGIGTVCFSVLRYSREGVQNLNAKSGFPQESGLISANSLIVAPDGSVLVFGDYSHLGMLFKFDTAGVQQWYYTWQNSEAGKKMIFEAGSGNLFVTGRTLILASGNPEEMVLARIDLTGAEKWFASYLGPDKRRTEGSDLAIDPSKNIFVTGYSYAGSFQNDLFLIKYDQDGRRIALDRYNSPHTGNDFGQAIITDSNGNAYVTGYSIYMGGEKAGASEFLTIKYSAVPKIQTQPNGAMRIQFHAIPSAQYAIEATTNFIDWTALITNAASANGILQFDDTQAPLFPHRFYRGKQP